MIVKKVLIWFSHFHAYDMEPGSFEAGDYLSDDAATYTIRLQYYQSSLYVSHFFR